VRHQTRVSLQSDHIVKNGEGTPNFGTKKNIGSTGEGGGGKRNNPFTLLFPGCRGKGKKIIYFIMCPYCLKKLQIKRGGEGAATNTNDEVTLVRRQLFSFNQECILAAGKGSFLVTRRGGEKKRGRRGTTIYLTFVGEEGGGPRMVA